MDVGKCTYAGNGGAARRAVVEELNSARGGDVSVPRVARVEELECEVVGDAGGACGT
jgi:hypothetical protein